MRNTRRTKRRKSPSATRKHSSKRVVQALAAGAAIAAGTQAYADPIRFDNPPGPGHFNWIPEVVGDSIFLDMLLPAESQTGEGTYPVAKFSQQLGVGYTIVDNAAWGMDLECGGYMNYFVVGVDSGTLIPSGAAWSGPITPVTYYPGFGSELTPGEQTYLGVKYDPGDGYRYGWIGVYVTPGYELDAFAWGYETEAGVPIPAGAIPEPGTLAALALGAAALLAARRRVRSQID